MQIITTIAELREQLKQWRQAGDTIGLVPTMGNLHAGHLQLVTTAQEQVKRVVVSVFVNPMQFCEGEDFDCYPRTGHEDAAKLQTANVDIMFKPSTKEIYPQKPLTTVTVAEISEDYCGASRLGHFDGVANVVCKLFNIVQADKAFFGEKDFQQLAIIRTMVADLSIATDIIAVNIVREADGLAMSSRNGYLNDEQRLQAPFLYKILHWAKDELLLRALSFKEIEAQACTLLALHHLEVEYFSICRQADLQAAEENDTNLIILAAIVLGSTRLLDNIQVTLN